MKHILKIICLQVNTVNLKYFIDLPKSQTLELSKDFVLDLKGWVFVRDIKNVQIVFDYAPNVRHDLNVDRPDVVKKYTDSPLRCGFNFEITLVRDFRIGVYIDNVIYYFAHIIFEQVGLLEPTMINNKKNLIIGMSHTHALRIAITINETFEFFIIEPNKEDYTQINVENYKNVIFSIGGNNHNIFGLVNLPQPFDFFLPSNIDLPSQADVQLLPFKLVQGIFERIGMNGLFLLTNKLASFFKDSNIYLIDAPPPIPEAIVRKYSEPFAKSIKQLGVSPAAFRYKIWLLQSKMIQENCIKNGITFIKIPAETQNPDGLLKEIYCATDSTHANALYGDLVLKQIGAHINGA